MKFPAPRYLDVDPDDDKKKRDRLETAYKAAIVKARQAEMSDAERKVRGL